VCLPIIPPFLLHNGTCFGPTVRDYNFIKVKTRSVQIVYKYIIKYIKQIYMSKSILDNKLKRIIINNYVYLIIIWTIIYLLFSFLNGPIGSAHVANDEEK
jgi:hypothetical protein